MIQLEKALYCGVPKDFYRDNQLERLRNVFHTHNTFESSHLNQQVKE